ncbi:MAG: LytR family transcriptional regulator [Chloroflexi bacterium]|nr:MAG: LytR family transcriptional regulator [Chloroflexota bacterium]
MPRLGELHPARSTQGNIRVRMPKARPRARRSRYSVSHRLTRSVPAMIGAAALVVILVAASLTYKRIDDFFTATTGHHLNPLAEVVQAVEPSPGTIAYKLQHGQRVNILMLGMGGYENDAPFLTDSIMAVTIDPNSHRVMLASIPRDLVVHMNVQSNPNSIWTNKINAAYEVPYTSIICCVASQYQGRDGGGHAAEHEVSKITGLNFDRYIAVDFKAFRDMVNALGGVDVCLTSNLDDYTYPNYGHGYIALHFRAGCQHLNGEQALEVARSRHAVQSEQSSDFGRSRRQQDIMYAIKKKATTVNGFAKAPQLLDALQKNIHTDMSLSDMKAIYDWGKKGKLRHGPVRVATLSGGSQLPDDQAVHWVGLYRPGDTGRAGARADHQRLVYVQRPGRSRDHDARPGRPAAGGPGHAPVVPRNSDPRLLGRALPVDRKMAGQLLRRHGGRRDAGQPCTRSRPADLRPRGGARSRLRRPLVRALAILVGRARTIRV